MRQYLSLLAAAGLWTACATKTAPDTTTASTDSTIAVQQTAPPNTSFDIGLQRFSVYLLDKSPFSPLPEIDFDSAEGPNLQQDAGKVKRQGDALIFTLNNGKTTTLVSKPHPEIDEDYTVYYYAGYLKDIQQYLVFASYYESSEYMLINPENGKRIPMIGVPAMSPDKKYLMCAAYDLETGNDPNGFEFFLYNNGDVQKIGETTVEKWGPGQIRWVDARTLEAEMMLQDTSAMPVVKGMKIVME